MATRTGGLLARLRNPGHRTIVCDECGTENDASIARWCGYCGRRLAPTAVPTDRRNTDRRPDGSPDRRRWGALIGVLAVLGALVVMAQARPDISAPRGFTARGEPTRTGVVSTVDVRAPTEVDWTVDLGYRAIMGMAVEVGSAYTGITTERTLLVVDVGTGEPVVRVPWTGDSIVAPPVQIGAVLVVPTTDNLLGLSRSTGEVLWQVSVRVTAEPAATEDRIAVFDGGSLRGIAADGSELWRRNLFELTGGSFRLVGRMGDTYGVLVIPDADRVGELIAIQLSDGQIRWSTPVELGAGAGSGTVEPDTTSSIATSDRLVAAIAPDGTVDLIDIPTGRSLGELSITLASPVGEAGIIDDSLVVETVDGTLFSLDIASGDVRWRQRSPLESLFAVGGGANQVGLFGVGLDEAGTRTFRHVGLDLTDGTVQVEQSLPEVAGFGFLPGSGDLLVVDQRRRVLVRYGAQGVAVWERVLPGPDFPAVAVAGDEVYAQSSRGMSRIDAGTGEVVYTLTTRSGEEARFFDGSLAITPAVGEDVVMVSPPPLLPPAQEGLFGVDRETGVLLWNRDGDTTPPRGPLTLDPDAGLVFVPIRDEIHGHDLRTGRRSFAARAGRVRGPVAVTPEFVIASSSSNVPVFSALETSGLPPDVIAIRRADRLTAWQAPVRACGPPAVVGDTVVIPTPTNVTALELRTGEVRWTADRDDASCRELAMTDDVVVSATNGGTAAFDLLDGTRRWSTTSPASVAPAIAGSAALVGTTGGDLVAYDLVTGDERWRFELPEVAASAPVVADGRLMLVLRDGRLIALRG